MSFSTPTTDDPLRKEAIDLATDVASLMVSLKGGVRAEDAYVVAMECVRAADRIQKARLEAMPWEAAARFKEARTAALKAMIALDRSGAHVAMPVAPVDSLHRRLHELALALGALAQDDKE